MHISHHIPEIIAGLKIETIMPEQKKLNNWKLIIFAREIVLSKNFCKCQQVIADSKTPTSGRNGKLVSIVDIEYNGGCAEQHELYDSLEHDNASSARPVNMDCVLR